MFQERVRHDGDPLQGHDFIRLVQQTGHARLCGCPLAAPTFDVDELHLIGERGDRLAGEALRVLALAYRRLDAALETAAARRRAAVTAWEAHRIERDTPASVVGHPA